MNQYGWYGKKDMRIYKTPQSWKWTILWGQARYTFPSFEAAVEFCAGVYASRRRANPKFFESGNVVD